MTAGWGRSAGRRGLLRQRRSTIAAKHIFLLVVLALVALSTTAVAKSAAARTYVANCGSAGYLQYKPGSWDTGCTGDRDLFRLRWNSYGTQHAHARGHADLRVVAPGCSPYFKCPLYRSHARARFFRVRKCRGPEGRLSYFTRVRREVWMRAKNPWGHPKGWRKDGTFKIPGGGCKLVALNCGDAGDALYSVRATGINCSEGRRVARGYESRNDCTSDGRCRVLGFRCRGARADSSVDAKDARCRSGGLIVSFLWDE